MNKPDNNMDLIIRALENNLPMNEIYELNDHGINIFKQTYELIIKYEPIINDLTDSSINIPCVLSKLNERLLCKHNSKGKLCNLSKVNKDIICTPIKSVKRKFGKFEKWK